MDSELIKIIKQAAAEKKFTVNKAAFKQLQEYDQKWKAKHKAKWNTPLIQAVLADSAIKIAQKEGRKVIDGRNMMGAVWAWHQEGQINDCSHAGLSIVKRAKPAGKKAFAFKLEPSIALFVKKQIAQ